MKATDIHVGRLYKVGRGYSYVVPIDKGKFSPVKTDDVARVARYKGFDIEIGRSWYCPADAERSRIVVIDLLHEQVGVVTSNSITEELNDEEAKKVLEDLITRQQRKEIQNRLNARSTSSRAGLASILGEIVGVDVDDFAYEERNNPIRVLLREPQLLMNMLTVYMNYLHLQNHRIKGHDPLDLLAEVKDAFRSVELATQQAEHFDEKVRNAVRARIDANFEEPVRIEVA